MNLIKKVTKRISKLARRYGRSHALTQGVRIQFEDEAGAIVQGTILGQQDGVVRVQLDPDEPGEVAPVVDVSAAQVRSKSKKHAA